MFARKCALFIAVTVVIAGCSGLGSAPENYEGHEEYKALQADRVAKIRDVGAEMARDFMHTSVYVRDHRTTPPKCFLFGRYASNPEGKGGYSTSIAGVDCAGLTDIALEFGKN